MPKFNWDDHQEVDPAAGPWQKYAAAPAAAPEGPWSKYQTPKPDPEQAPGTSAGQAALEHFGNAASLGYLPHLQGLAQMVTPDPNADLDAKLRSQGFNVQSDKPTYLSTRDATSKRLEQESQEHPIAATAGGAGGTLASAIAASALTPLNAATKMGRVVQAAKAGAALGAAANPGDTEGEITGLQAEDRLKNAALGGATGALGQGAVEGLATGAKAIGKIPDALRAKAEERAFKSAGANIKNYRQIAGQDRVNEIGRYMLDNGLIKPGMGVDDIARVAASLKSQSGSEIGAILNRLDEAGVSGPSAQDLARTVEGQAGPMKDLATAQPTYKALSDVAGDIRKMGTEPAVGVAKGEVSSLTGRGTEYLQDNEGNVIAQFRDGKMVQQAGPPTVSKGLGEASTAITPANVGEGIPGTFKNAQDIKNFVADQVNKSGGFKALNPSEKNLALKQVYSMVKGKLEDAADKGAGALGDPNLLENYIKSKKNFGNATDIAGIAEDAGLRNKSNRFFSPTDYLTGAVGAATGGSHGEDFADRAKNAAIGASLGLAHKYARTYGTPMVSLALDKSADALTKSGLASVGRAAGPLIAAAQRSPLAVAASRLSNQPEFTPKTDEMKGEDRWVANGAKNLGIDQDSYQKLSQSKEGRRLLIQASDLKPGSPALKRIQDQLKQDQGYYDGGVVGADSAQPKKPQDASGIGDLGISTHTDPEKRKQVSASLGKAFGFSHGGLIPGKAVVPGNSPKNDTVKINASPGEIVVPVTDSSNPVSAAMFAANAAMDVPVHEKRWAIQGAQKLGLSDAHVAQLSASPHARQLLIQASTLSLGNKAGLKRIMDQLQKGGGK